MGHHPATPSQPAPLIEALESRQLMDSAGATMDTALVIGSDVPLSTGSFMQETAGGGDEDLFRLNLLQRRDVGLMIFGGTSIATIRRMTADLNMELYDAQGRQIAASRAAGTANDSILIDLDPGTYYVRVRGADASVGETAYQYLFLTGAPVGRVPIHTATGAFAKGHDFGSPLPGSPAALGAPALNPPAPPVTPPAPPAPSAPPVQVTVPPAAPTPPSPAIPGQSALSAAAILGRLSRAAINTNAVLTPSAAERTYGYQLAASSKVRFDVGNVTGRSVMVQIVDSRGRLVKQSEVAVGRSLRYDVRLAAGNYYVRVFSPSAAAAGARISVTTI